jgi:hypothetical protein
MAVNEKDPVRMGSLIPADEMAHVEAHVVTALSAAVFQTIMPILFLGMLRMVRR